MSTEQDAPDPGSSAALRSRPAPTPVRTGLFEGAGRCPSCQMTSLERFELPTQSQVGERNPGTWPCRCGAEVEGSATCLAVSPTGARG
jgi:hypothetical protein